MSDILSCPSCALPLQRQGPSFLCTKNHTYDLSKEGYVNLLLVQHKNSTDPGDTKDMLRARRDFLQKSFYSPLSDRINTLCAEYCGTAAPTVLDIGCGEGWYTERLRSTLEKSDITAEVFGMDISKEAVRLAALHKTDIRYIVASMRRLPFLDQRIDVIISIFAPLHFPEVRRVLRPSGKAIVVRPGPRHLQQFKSALGFTKLLHEEPALGETETGMKAIRTESVTGSMLLPTQEDIMHLCKMTPMFWKSSSSAQESVRSMKELSTDFDFRVSILSA